MHAARRSRGAASLLLALTVLAACSESPPAERAEPTPTGSNTPSVVLDEIDLGGDGWAMTRSEGALWVQVDAPVDAIARVDVSTGSVVPVVPGGHRAAYGPEGLWVVGEDWLAKVDPDSSKQLVRVPLGGELALGKGAVWLFNDRGLHRVDPATGEVAPATATKAVRLCGDPGGMVIAFDSAWVACKEGKVVRIRLSDGDATAVRSDYGSHTLASTDDAVWVTNYRAVTVSRIDPETGEVTNVPRVGGGSGITTGGGYVWSSSPDGVAVIDPRTSAVVRSLPLDPGLGGKVYELVWDDGDLWATTGSSRLLRLDAGS